MKKAILEKKGKKDFSKIASEFQKAYRTRSFKIENLIKKELFMLPPMSKQSQEYKARLY